jgi:hypothetical protein
MNKIYFLEIVSENITEFDIDSTDNHPIYEDLSNCLDEDDVEYLGFTNDDDIFVRLPDYKVDKITAVLSKYFEFTKTDVTDKVISGEIAKIYPEVKEVTPKLFTDFRLDNTSVDDILDKIIESGIDSLDKIDKTILKKSHSK